jgi:hypothetical protein
MHVTEVDADSSVGAAPIINFFILSEVYRSLPDVVSVLTAFAPHSLNPFDWNDCSSILQSFNKSSIAFNASLCSIERLPLYESAQFACLPQESTVCARSMQVHGFALRCRNPVHRARPPPLRKHPSLGKKARRADLVIQKPPSIDFIRTQLLLFTICPMHHFWWALRIFCPQLQRFFKSHPSLESWYAWKGS